MDEVLDVARAGAEAGCHEALFTLGEFPEDRYPEARRWLDDHGFGSTIDYVLHAAQTGPRRDRPAAARECRRARPGRPGSRCDAVSPSQGMMIESLNPDLPAHRGRSGQGPRASAGDPAHGR